MRYNDRHLLKAVDVEDAEFSFSLRGYDRDEVDDFLDIVAGSLLEYAKMHASDEIRIRALEEDLAAAREDLKQLQEENAVAETGTDSPGAQSGGLLPQENCHFPASGNTDPVLKISLERDIAELKTAKECLVRELGNALDRYSLILEKLVSTGTENPR